MSNKKISVILAVDLDNTLIKTDMIYIGIKYLLFYKPYLVPKLLWLLIFRGKPYAKKYLYDNTSFDIKKISFNDSVANFIKLNRSNYTHIILISGSYFKYVNYIARYLNLFDSSVGTTLEINMISTNKVEYLQNKYNDFIFDYIGDSIKDIPVWEQARTAYVVDNGNILDKIKHINYKIIS